MAINLNYKNLFDYLINTNLCNKEDIDYIKVDARHSNNCNWIIELPENRGNLVVKQTPHYNILNTDDRIRKEWYVYNFFKSVKGLDYSSSLTPIPLHFDEKNHIIINKYPSNYTSLEEYYENNQVFPRNIPELIGITLAKLHYQTMNSQSCYDFIAKLKSKKFEYQLPFPDYLSDYLVNPIEPESLKKTPSKSWRFIGIFQNHESVRIIVHELLSYQRNCCLTHNNIQFKKIFIPRNWENLISEINNLDRSLIQIIDWETCSWGDPACDLGKAITGYFLVWLKSMIIHPAIEIKKSIQLAAIPLELIHSSIVEIAKAYIKIFPQILEDYPEFIKRVIQFAGLGLIYHLLTEFQLQPEMAILHQNLYFYIASQLLCKPEKFLSM